MKKLKENIGMTMAEVLIVVAIVAVLGGVAFVAVWNYQRSMGQLERDEIAKEIFVAAQNHLTAVYGEGYQGLENAFGTEETTTDEETGNKKGTGIYYYIVNGTIPKNTALEQMLPFGSIDETVRLGGSYIIRYQKEPGLVLDVFYCTNSGSPERFNVELLKEEDYSRAMEVRDSKGKRKTGEWRGTSNGPILGYYGGVDAPELPTATLLSPTIIVHNEEKLYVEVTNPNINVTNLSNDSVIVSVRLLIKGLSSGTNHYINVTNTSQIIILDDITTSEGHFANRHFDDMTGELSNGFIPGENIEIQAVAFSAGTLTNIAYSNKWITNSLFESIADLPDTTEESNTDPSTDNVLETAYIGNIRHLENLDAYVSNLGSNRDDYNYEMFSITTARQTTDFSWNTFKEKTDGDNTVVYYSTGGAYSPGTSTNSQSYYPISPGYMLTYDGQNHSISDVAVDATGDAGLFGATSSVTAISNLELIDFNITGTTSAGALAGTLTNCTVTNVLARNRDNSATSLAKKIMATTDAGGLIGKLTSGTVQYSAAAVIVNGSTTAGGLIGSAGGKIIGCYSGGHTKNGSYAKWLEPTKDSNNETVTNPFDVIGATAGGLVGSSSAEISDSYSTCSVSGTTAGGFAGSASGKITNCYATGLVSGSTQFAFLGSGEVSLSQNYYYRVINEVEKTENGKTITEPMEPYPNAGEVSNHLNKTKPLDLNAESYNEFVGIFKPEEEPEEDGWNPARAYDPALVQYYSGKYTLQTVDELNPSATLPTGTTWADLFVTTHYGDWPSPEVFFINE